MHVRRIPASPSRSTPRVAAPQAGSAQRGTRWLSWLAVAALLASQWLAVVHGVTHSRGGVTRGAAASVLAVASAPASASGSGAASSDRSWAQHALKAVTQHGEGSAWCQLLDQLAQPAPASVASAAAALPTAAAGPAAGDVPAPAAASVAAYWARAPPPLA